MLRVITIIPHCPPSIRGALFYFRIMNKLTKLGRRILLLGRKAATVVLLLYYLTILFHLCIFASFKQTKKLAKLINTIALKVLNII
jgi:hypothetical protein